MPPLICPGPPRCHRHRQTRLAVAFLSLLALTACGGGGGGGDAGTARSTATGVTVAAAAPAASVAAAADTANTVSAPTAAASVPTTTTTTTPTTGTPVATAAPAPSTPAAPTPATLVTPAPAATVPAVTPATPTTAATTTPAAPAPAATPAPVPVVVAIAAPVIVAQPQSAVSTGGQAATFRVTATSSAPATYQWSRAGLPLAGATADSYLIPAVKTSDNGAAFTVAVTNVGGTTTSAVARLTVNAAPRQQASALRPFSDQSLWNSRPTQFVLGSYQVPPSFYFPTVDDGAYSLSAAVASPADQPVSVKGLVGSSGLYIADAETFVEEIVIPHWPASVTPATGTDGHADIIDAAANKIHSFWQLKSVDGQWRAAQYTWTTLDGSGWGTPAQYMQGSRAAGVPTIAGVIRLHELDDGLPSYRHALAMSMPETALSNWPTYAFPATSADGDAYWVNKGSIPEGALMMLPADFDMSRIKNPRLIKIVQTLKSYGAYVVDRNFGTPFVVYVENGPSDFSLMPRGEWDNQIAAELDTIRAALRQVVSATEWVDANGTPFTPDRNLNLLSMRGPWYPMLGNTVGTFDSWSQEVVFPNNGQQVMQINATGRCTQSLVGVATPAGKLFKLVVGGTGGATFRLVFNQSGPNLYDTGYIGNGTVVYFRWPLEGVWPWIVVASNPQGGGTMSATLVAVDAQ